MVGFDSQNKNTIGTQYICFTCTYILRDPVQLLCGHRCCESCINDEKKESIKCSQCPKVTLKSEAFYDRGIKNDMEKLNINCFLCRWNDVFKNYQDHLTKNHRQVLCPSSTYKISIEEENPPAEILLQQQDSITSYDGTLLWKFDDIKSILNGTGSVFTSPSFYTSTYGYKMCVRLSLNGNSIGQSTHISIFLVLMRGDYDAILTWPFNFQVIFCLYNFINTKSHIINTKSPSFQRPQSSTNFQSGFSEFIPISAIQQENNPYVHNGSTYIKVMITEDPIPISILSNVMNIDHALPIYKRQEIVYELKNFL